MALAREGLNRREGENHDHGCTQNDFYAEIHFAAHLTKGGKPDPHLDVGTNIGQYPKRSVTAGKKTTSRPLRINPSVIRPSGFQRSVSAEPAH